MTRTITSLLVLVLLLGTAASAQAPSSSPSNVEPPPRSLEALEAALAAERARSAALLARLEALEVRRQPLRPADFAFQGLLGRKDVRAWTFEVNGGSSPLEVIEALGYRADTWTLVVIRVRNPEGQPPWVQGEARLTSADGHSVKVRRVLMDRARLGPGEEGLVAVEADVPPLPPGALYHLEVLGADGAPPLPIFLGRL